MQTFYFTYGTEGHPFYGGWTEIEAPDEACARDLFRIFHPDKIDGFLNCSTVYTEDHFKTTAMYGPSGNFGYRCHEKITVIRELC